MFFRRAPLTSAHSLESNVQPVPPQKPQPPPHRNEPFSVHVTQKQPAKQQTTPPTQPNPALPSFTNLHNVGPKPFPKDTNGDIDVSETVVLPRKRADRMDFTQKWLSDDIKSWAENPSTKPDLILNPNEQVWENGNDSDERSVGSCSAEVAAINAGDGRKKKVRETPDIIKSSKHHRYLFIFEGLFKLLLVLKNQLKTSNSHPTLGQSVLSPTGPNPNMLSHQPQTCKRSFPPLLCRN